MKVEIESNRINIGENSLEYYAYYFAIWADHNKFDHRQIVRNALSQWAAALSALASGLYPAVYLPYNLEDQDCKFLKAEIDGEDIILTDLLVRDDGYAMDLDDLSDRIYSAPEIIMNFTDINGKEHDTSPKFFGRYKAKELIQALNDAKFSDTAMETDFHWQ